ncbi:Mrp/NBP35 family ATP-binding protein [Brevundimonas diminuta]|uniref:Mrp/NBP35 family ATP-binding protein n=1 Tax=Brevundimonas TaxID=41275 RepID=UPI00190435DF|nr:MULTISPECIES: Mrp/NBP35 family ATP-binding protein [Brevundimonas]MBK1969365.1 Mrp/NBP35 family ATP-binding protein [Brevundimonas diminuta]MBK1975560.1 Mrp/NBP35 family ATP-binding protein [Brevundimonas diminuta]MDA0742966.1 Mrp/NBP35 family ATP-binding protein [Pseudomonadota bacterium]
MTDRAAVLAALDAVIDPKSGQGLATAGLVQGLVVADGRAGFVMEVPVKETALYAPVRDAAEAALKAMPGMERVSVVLTAEAVAAAPRRTAGLSKAATDQGRPKAPVPTDRPAHVKRVLAVASGKGGVGKSTVAVNLAAALAARGLSVGVLDADVYGPSLPTMLGLSGQPAYEDGAMVPHTAHGLKAMSVGLLTKAEDAMIWRGPMASQAITQMLTQTRWGTQEQPLDVLVIDLPPGTGDVQLTLIQKTPLDGAVIVSTPQEVALADARRAHALFAKVGVPTLGLIENMSGEVFGTGGAEAEAARLDAPYLGDLPLDGALRRAGDAGRPLIVAEPDGDIARRFDAVARQVAGALGLGPEGEKARA